MSAPEKTGMDDAAQDALCIVATEWWKCSQRLVRLTFEAAPGRVERERAQLTYAGRRIGQALKALGLQMREFDGQPWSVSLPAEPVNPEDFGAEDELEVAETLEPTILRDGRIVSRGKVVLRRAAARA